jgi:hypothetical protein
MKVWLSGLPTRDRPFDRRAIDVFFEILRTDLWILSQLGETQRLRQLSF